MEALKRDRQRLNIIGAGVVGKALAQLWFEQDLLTIGGVLNRTAHSSINAVNKIGSGIAVNSPHELPKADIWMVSTTDDALELVVDNLCNVDLSSTVVFHCSGAVSSEILKPLNALAVASLHPIKSFVDSQTAFSTFIGTYCTIEGDPEAVKQLAPLISAIGGIPIEISSESKLLYHAALVMVSNYIAALVYSGEELLIRAGVPRDLAIKVIAPLATESLQNSLSLGPVSALTGPIQRGELGVVSSEIEALLKTSSNFHESYVALGKTALTMASKRGLDPAVAQEMKDLLET